ncbi:MAG TPA: sulfatase [Planctomycetota bacterium]|nr:sulfatase [Planctomycetota bacterium]OQC22347.1 MAG: Arylsulfatase [Planctomycetes bacterium ADurb.Bin069]HNR98812.1 sulfatase [Planctomycetota bacterium]HNU26588.1 sulfatase [Planctomycetota bacterium]HOE29202.1 sulfatase [Planctomycetota bacterium]
MRYGDVQRCLRVCRAGLLAALLAAPAGAGEPSVRPRPNILYIMADDHAAHAIGAYGSRVNKTPHIDRLAAEGIRFDRCYAVNSICTPSRASILTGKYSHKNGVPVFNRFDGSQPTVAKYLQAAGYFTGMFGKWHLGSDPTGFDRWMILPGQGVYHNPVFYSAEGRVDFQGYVTDIVTDLTIAFLDERPKDRPFFVMCHHKAPHRHWQPDAKHAETYGGGGIPEPATLRDDYAGRASAAREATMTVARHLNRRDLKLEPPAELKGADRERWLSAVPMEVTVEANGVRTTLTGDALLKWKYQRYMRDYLGCVASIDDNVGRLLAYLDRNGLAENTIVIYASDQGFFLGDHGWYDKRFMYEESIKMPFLVRWPGTAPPGSVQGAIALNIDIAPTFLEAAGLPIPPDIQGRSLAPLCRGERPADWRASWYYRYYHDPGHHNTRAHYGVGTETHKLLCFWKTDEWELYDLAKDPAELRNVFGDPAYADTVAALKAELRRLKAEVGDDDRYAHEQPPDGADAMPELLKKKAPAPPGAVR